MRGLVAHDDRAMHGRVHGTTGENCLPGFSLLGSCAEAIGTIVAEQATPRTHAASPAQTGRGKPPGGSEPGSDPRALRQPPGEGGSDGGDPAGGLVARGWRDEEARALSARD